MEYNSLHHQIKQHGIKAILSNSKPSIASLKLQYGESFPNKHSYLTPSDNPVLMHTLSPVSTFLFYLIGVLLSK